MIDRSKEPNFNSLEESKQIQIKKQIELMYNYKYTFIHYNMGASLVTHLLKTFYPNHNDIKRAIFDRVKIGRNSVVGSGSLVTKDLPNNVLAYGNPCKIIRNIKNGEKFLK